MVGAVFIIRMEISCQATGSCPSPALQTQPSTCAMSVAVIIPVYNGENHLRQTLDCVLAQTLRPDEIVVVDDGSTDSSPSIVEEYSGVQLLESPGEGPNAARNHGLRETGAAQVAFLDHDDVWHPQHLQRLSNSLEQEPGSPAAASGRGTFQDGEQPRFAAEARGCYLHDPWDRYPGNAMGEPLVALVRRDALEEVGGWSPQHDGCGDFYLWLKLGLLGPFVVRESATAARRLHDRSFASDLRKNDLLNYYGRHVDASHEALRLRADKGLCTDAYHRRHQAEEAMLDLLRVLLGSEAGSLQRAATKFDRSLSEASRDELRPVWSTFQWYLRPYIQDVGARAFSSQIFRLTERWPRPDSELRSMLREWSFRYTPTFDLISHHPLNALCWSHVLSRMCRRVRIYLHSR